MEANLQKLYASRTRFVYDFAGAGALALLRLHSVGGSSRGVLEASDLYSHAALQLAMSDVAEWGVDSKGSTTSQQAAVRLALHALSRARMLHDVEVHQGLYKNGEVVQEQGGGSEQNAKVKLVGVSCLAAICTDRVRKGQDRAFVGVACDDAPNEVVVRCLVISKEKVRSRHDQEVLVSDLVMNALFHVALGEKEFPKDQIVHGFTQEVYVPDLDAYSETTVKLLAGK